MTPPEEAALELKISVIQTSGDKGEGRMFM